MKKIILLIVSLLLSLSYTYSYNLTTADKQILARVYKGIDIIHKKDPTKIQRIQTKLVGAKSKFKSNTRILYIISSLENHIVNLSTNDSITELNEKHIDLFIQTLQKYYGEGNFTELIGRENVYLENVSQEIFDGENRILDSMTNYMFTKEFLSNIFSVQSTLNKQLDIYKNYKPLTTKQKLRLQKDFKEKGTRPRSNMLFQLPKGFSYSINGDKLILHGPKKVKVPHIQLNDGKISFFIGGGMYDTYVTKGELKFDYLTPISDGIEDNKRMNILSFNEENIIKLQKIHKVLRHNFLGDDMIMMSDLLKMITTKTPRKQNELLHMIFGVKDNGDDFDFEEAQTFFHLIFFRYMPKIEGRSIIYERDQLPFMKEGFSITKMRDETTFGSYIDINYQEFRSRIELMHKTFQEINQ